MKKLVVATVLALIFGSAYAQDKGPAPQSGKDHPEVTRGAKESGAMDTTGANTRDGRKDASKGASEGAPKKSDTGK